MMTLTRTCLSTRTVRIPDIYAPNGQRTRLCLDVLCRVFVYTGFVVDLTDWDIIKYNSKFKPVYVGPGCNVF